MFTTASVFFVVAFRYDALNGTGSGDLSVYVQYTVVAMVAVAAAMAASVVAVAPVVAAVVPLNA